MNLPLKRFRDEFDLTEAEYRLVCRLIDGERLREASEALGISYETARSTLKAVFSKTGAHRQTELVLLAMRVSGRAML